MGLVLLALTSVETTTTTPFCETRLCFVSNVQRCIPPSEICDGEIYCDDRSDENGRYFPDDPKCKTTGMNDKNHLSSQKFMMVSSS